MKKDLIVLKNGELLVGTWDLSIGFQISHQAIKKLISKYQVRFERVGEHEIGEQVEASNAGFEIRHKNKKRGQKDMEFLLNEAQSIFLVTLLRNNEVVLSFKEKLVTEFLRMRRFLSKLISQRQNAEWLEKRDSGKIERRVETDAIKEFVEYAKSQGSQNAPKYYMAITKMQNSALFNLELVTFEYKNLRDVVNGLSLDNLKMADRIVEKALRDSMASKMYYQDIFKVCKARVETFSDHMGKMYIEEPKSLRIS